MSDSVRPETAAHQAPPSLGLSRQEHWSGLPFPSPGDLPDPGIEPRSPELQVDALLFESPHINQLNKDQIQRTNIKSSKGKTTNNTQGDSPRMEWQDILKSDERENPTTHVTVPSKDLIQI